MNIYIIGIVGLFIVGIILYFVFTVSPVAAANVAVDGPFELSSKQSILKASSFPVAAASLSFLQEGTGSFQAYVYLNTLLQTGSLSSCGALPNQPSCTSGQYDPCTCNNRVDCRNCAHDGYKNLISLYGVYNIEVLPFPDASRQNMISAQLSVQTQTADSAFVETVPLPPIPIQKWVMITISKTGRRIDVYYNSSLVSSSTMLNMISTTQVSGAIVQAGQSGLSGNIAVISMSNSSSTLGSVGASYSASSDTRGAPTKFKQSLTSYTNTIDSAKAGGILNTLCLDGSCLYLPRVGNTVASLSQFSDSLDGLSSSAAVSTVSPAFTVGTDYA